MLIRSVYSVSSSVLKKLKVFRTFCLAILQFFLNFFFFFNGQQQQRFAVFIFCEIGANSQKKIRQKLTPQKLVLEKIDFLVSDLKTAQIIYSFKLQ